MSSRCKACNRIMNEKEFIIDNELCTICRKSVYEDTYEYTSILNIEDLDDDLL